MSKVNPGCQGIELVSLHSSRHHDTTIITEVAESKMVKVQEPHADEVASQVIEALVSAVVASLIREDNCKGNDESIASSQQNDDIISVSSKDCHSVSKVSSTCDEDLACGEPQTSNDAPPSHEITTSSTPPRRNSTTDESDRFESDYKLGQLLTLNRNEFERSIDIGLDVFRRWIKITKAIAASVPKSKEALPDLKSIKLDFEFPRECIFQLSRILKHDTHSKAALSNRAHMYLKIKKFDNALEDSLHLLCLEPSASAYFACGAAYEGLGRFVDAEVAYREAHKINDDCLETIKSMKRVRMAALLHKGFNIVLCESAVQEFGSIQEALDGLDDVLTFRLKCQSSFKKLGTRLEAEEEFGYEEPKPALELNDIVSENVSNIYGCKVMIVNDFRSPKPEREVRKVLATAGEVVDLMYSHLDKYLRIEFATIDAPVKAVDALLAENIIKKTHKINFTAGRDQSALRTISSELQVKVCNYFDECRSFRLGACSFRDCKYKHLLMNKDIDSKLVRSMKRNRTRDIPAWAVQPMGR